ncbi:hypothetical protein BRADI_5g15893v3 [Brachypodium distachyon]|uniref:Uncharacterized protein n=1 Tax=Brachypodium distachyon TaxID=15368 RepID=A0A2K2CHJ2_BRADI|nr:hypothetical protein BRADI_5g15893v3 [Brachypodium distachyon]
MWRYRLLNKNNNSELIAPCYVVPDHLEEGEGCKASRYKILITWGEINHLGSFGLPTGQEIGHNHKRPEPEVLEVQ